MALIKCPECGHKVSDKAEMCPECGYPISKAVAKEPASQNNSGFNNTGDCETPKKFIKKVKISRICTLSAFSLFLAAGITFLLLFIYVKDVEYYSWGPEYYDNPAFTGLMVFFLMMSVYFIPFAILSFTYFAKSHNVNGYIITTIKSFNGYKFYVDDMRVYSKSKFFSFHTATLPLPNGQKIDIFITKKDFIVTLHAEAITDKNGNTVINNYYQQDANNVVKTKRGVKSDMEKKLIRNAKIDALANIDPTNTEKSKENLKIYKELDDLDD